MSKLKYYDGTEWKTVDGQITGDTLPIGSIIPYGSTTAPVNWLVCDGSAVSRTTYAELFAIIGTSYGSGDGSTTFNLPNLKGKVPVGQDTDDTDFDTIGETGGSKYLQEHDHYTTTDTSAKALSTSVSQAEAFSASGNANYRRNANLSTNKTSKTGTGDSGNLQPYQVVCYIIKAFQSSGLIANVSNTQSNSQTDAYSCNYINYIEANLKNANTYSTDEIDTGKIWIDGKHIYRKTIHIDRQSGSSISYQISFKSSGGIDTIVSINGIVKRDNYGWGFYRVDDNDQYRYWISNYSTGTIELTSGNNFPGPYHSADITMEYTKSS